MLDRKSHSWVCIMYLSLSYKSLGILSEYNLKNLFRTSGSGFCNPQQKGLSTLTKTSSPKPFSCKFMGSVSFLYNENHAFPALMSPAEIIKRKACYSRSLYLSGCDEGIQKVEEILVPDFPQTARNSMEAIHLSKPLKQNKRFLGIQIVLVPR